MKVIFEPGTKKFSYGSSSITPPSGPTNGDRKVALFRKDVAPQVSPLIKNAPEDLRQGLMQQEEDLDQISNVSNFRSCTLSSFVCSTFYFYCMFS